MFGFIFSAIGKVIGIAKKVKGQVDQKNENQEMIKFLDDLNILDTIQPILRGMDRNQKDIDDSLKGNVKNLEEVLNQLQKLMEDLQKSGSVTLFFNAQSIKTRYSLVYNKLVIVIQTMTFSVVVQLPEIGEQNKKAILTVQGHVKEVKAAITTVQATLDIGFDGVQESQAEMMKVLVFLKKEKEDNESITRHSEDSKVTVLDEQDILLVLDEVEEADLFDVFKVFGVTEADFALARQMYAGDTRNILIEAFNKYKKRAYNKANRFQLVYALGRKQVNEMKYKLAKKWGIILEY